MDYLSNLTLGELLGSFLAVTAIICTVLERMPKMISPWTKLFKFIGNAMNHDVLQRLDSIEKRLDSVEQQQKKSEEVRDEDRAVAARIRIIRLGDELIHNPEIRHSKDYFDQALKDVDIYENYCRTHEDFENNITEMTIKHIRAVYLKCMNEHSFL